MSKSYHYNDEDLLKLINGMNRTLYKLPQMLIRIICKYWSSGDMRRLLKLNTRYYSYHNSIFRSRRIPHTELSRLTCKCVIKSFTYKICVVIDGIFISIYPSIGKYRIGDSKKMIYTGLDDDFLNHPPKDCSIELKLKIFKATACEIKHKHKHENSCIEILIQHQDILDLSGGRISINVDNNIFTKNKHIQVYSWNGTIDNHFDVYADKCIESWDEMYFMESDGKWRFRN